MQIGLANKLSELVFNNCYFLTPKGILKQSNGFPMGGHSSREGLDNILLSSEVDILSVHSVTKNLLMYVRMVDDISVAMLSQFSSVQEFLLIIAKKYPPNMPLNVQLSFNYSRYLDCHVQNLLQVSTINKLTLALAYKEVMTFSYAQFCSNINPTYKGEFFFYTY